MNRQRRVRLNPGAVYIVGTGCIQVGSAVIELTVLEEDVFELLLRTPKVTVPWFRIEESTARSNMSLRATLRGLRDKLGTRAIRTHTGKGLNLQPQFVGTRRFALIDHPSRAIPFRKAE